ncbi:DUF2254 domain-containing protein [Qipengyuania sp. DY56-A-20]|jgi:uncharacterized membrane protein|uniref:DUF2254 domain-containing protein n=1 Tax=Qipengyuania benthica TaxID=3067651 RepID=A0ABT9H5L5_9SPHN|nr:DUF2254 domain-containing protein [Qipengyuania sp. DY56-A-20]MDP4538597.1 DUF2254 domain-containing protein [Qipengyuania sp. DY56-A-20]
MTRLRVFWQSINASYWFLPAIFSVSALVLALLTTWLDRSGMAQFLDEMPWLEPAMPEGASNMLTVIAGAMIGVASTVFSITIAAVAYASGNYGPRLLTNFMENRGNQFSLATFIGTFVYAITVLRTVRAREDAAPGLGLAEAAGFVPQLSLLVAFALMGASVAVLVYFLNHIPASIRVNSVLSGIGARLLHDIGERFPERNSGEPALAAPTGTPLVATKTGYIQAIAFKRLEEIARREHGKLKLAVRIGDFIHPEVTIAFWADMDAVQDRPDDEVRECFTLGSMRTPNQDTRFLIDELVEIALRALSPGINDPFTAVTAVHWLGAATAELGKRDLTRTFALDGEEPHLVLLEDDFEHYLARGFGAVRGGIATNRIAAQVTFDALVDSATMIDDETRRAAIRKEGELLVQQARRHLVGPELDAVEARYQQFLQRIER